MDRILQARIAALRVAEAAERLLHGPWPDALGELTEAVRAYQRAKHEISAICSDPLTAIEGRLASQPTVGTRIVWNGDEQEGVIEGVGSNVAMRFDGNLMRWLTPEQFRDAIATGKLRLIG
jgi:hypothetical protein